MSLFTKKCAIVASAASKSESRPELSGVLVMPDGMAATDGYILAEVKMKRQAKDEDYPVIDGKPAPITLPAPVIAPAKFIDQLGKSIGKHPALTILENAALVKSTDTDIAFTTTNLENATEHTSRTIAGKFPNYEDIIPKTDPTASVTVDAGLLLRVAKILANFYKGGNHLKSVKINVHGATSPIVLTAETSDHSARVLIMPMIMRT